MTYITVEADINLNDYVSELGTYKLKYELERRGYICCFEKNYVLPPDNPKLDVKRQICDFLGISYHTDKKQVLKLLEEKFKD